MSSVSSVLQELSTSSPASMTKEVAELGRQQDSAGKILEGIQPDLSCP